MVKYLRAEWTELLGGECDSWGSSTWYFELDHDNYPIRQVVVFSNGIHIKYDRSKMVDQYSSLGDQSIDEEDGWGKEICKSEFEEEWNSEVLNYK